MRLGILQTIHTPLLNLCFVPIVAGTVFLWMKKDKAFSLIDVIGEFTARKDEAKLYVAFNSQELRNGCPILMDKKRMKSNVTMREFYSDISMNSWIEKQEEIADAMNCHFVEKLRYGGKADGKRIVMVTAKGRKNISRGNLYDEEF